MMISSWVISWSVLDDLSRESVLQPHDGLVDEVCEAVGCCLVLDDQPGGDGHHGRALGQTFLCGKPSTK